MAMPDQDETEPVDPKEFLRALLHISSDDAEKAREESPATRKRKPPEGPRHDYGEDSTEQA